MDIYGVGTKLATCMGEGGGALGGVYKLVRIGDRPTLKVTSDIAKATLPDRKRVVRAVAPDGSFIQDVICLAGEDIRPGDTVFDPTNPLQHVTIPGDARFEEIRSVVMTGGKKTSRTPSPLGELADRCADQLRQASPGMPPLHQPPPLQGVHQQRAEPPEDQADGRGATGILTGGAATAAASLLGPALLFDVVA